MSDTTIKHSVLFQANDLGIFVDLYSDKTTTVFAAVGSLLVFLAIILPGQHKKAFHPIAYRSS